MTPATAPAPAPEARMKEQTPRAEPGKKDEATTWLPGVEMPLPAGDTLLWSGQPDLRSTALNVLHLRALMVYWALVAGAFLVWSAVGGATMGSLAADLAWLLVVAVAGTGIVFGFAWLIRRTTLYAVTDRRVVMKIGITLSAVLNLPYGKLGKVDLRAFGDETGDVILTPSTEDRVGWIFLWPHNRPWKLKDPIPALRCIPDAERIGRDIAERVRAAALAADESLAEEAS